MKRPYNVLFLCTGNSCRSILAEALVNRLGQGQFVGHSAGSLLAKLDYDTSGFRSKAWDEFAKTQNPDTPELDFVFTVCDNAAGEVCPIWPGQPMSAHWGVPDPADATGSEAEIALAFADTYRKLQNRIEAFVNLPMATLDRLTLQAKLTEIGKTRDEA